MFPYYDHSDYRILALTYNRKKFPPSDAVT
jgi:hypothetical protein